MGESLNGLRHSIILCQLPKESMEGGCNTMQYQLLPKLRHKINQHDHPGSDHNRLFTNIALIYLCKLTSCLIRSSDHPSATSTPATCLTQLMQLLLLFLQIRLLFRGHQSMYDVTHPCFMFMTMCLHVCHDSI